MKYICTDSEYGEEIFTFPQSVHHDAMAEVLGGIKNHTHGNWERVRREPISAGFIDRNDNCFGKSETLGVESRGTDDTVLLAEQKIRNF